MEERRNGYKIMIADDDQNVHSALSPYFRREGHQILSAFNGEEAMALIEKASPDMVILDIVMPKMDGLEVCREIRKKSNVPIIMLTAKGEEFDKLLGLELGADDYITKPFSPREVQARVKAVFRRMRDMKNKDCGEQLIIGNLEIDRGGYIVKLNGMPIACTPKETEILWTLAGNPGMVFSREHLLQSIWGYDFLGDTRAVDSHIKRIRAKLCNDENNWDIKTVWGVGYRLEVKDSASEE